MSRMFKSITRTWSPFTGCLFSCAYCWARPLAEGRLRHLEKYKDGFKPASHPDELNRKFNPGEFVFISSMGDIAFAGEFVKAVSDVICRFPETKFLFQSKDPFVFHKEEFPKRDHIYYGTTIETNFLNGWSKAPSPALRYVYLRDLRHNRKFVSIEPIMDFDVDTLVWWIKTIQPEIVEIGADNHHHHLPEPPWSKVEAILKALRDFVPTVVEKEGLERLRR